MFKKLKSVRVFLTACLIVSIIFAVYSINYKMNNWGFSTNYKGVTDIWTIEAHIAFTPTGDPIKVSIARPTTNAEYQILDEDVVAPGYQKKTTANRIVLTSNAKDVSKIQDIYYRVVLYNSPVSAPLKKTAADKITPLVPLSDHDMDVAKKILAASKGYEGTRAAQVITLLNQPQPDPVVRTFVPDRRTPRESAELIQMLLSIENVPARIVRGVRLSEDKKSFSADILLEVLERGEWTVYNIETAEQGIPKDFVIFQRAGDSLVDVAGGADSAVKFSVLKSLRSNFAMAKHKAESVKTSPLFDYEYSIYNLPVGQQNALKWLMIFPLAIFVVVIMRNIIGLKTMGTFTPMLIAMALLQTGLGIGLICFAIIIGAGLFVRTLLSRFNLLLVPRISAVVIFVILIIQAFTVIGYNMHFEIASSALFFPIIITAWIIERASITWEESGLKSAAKEIICTVFVGIITYFMIVNEFIRHIMFAFNELNLVVLCVVMLLGTYTGYRLTELTRFSPLKQKNRKGKK